MGLYLWPGCGWQLVSLTDLITGANVKNAYRKATQCIHPDKVQQKGANLQQKYVAEKVFDLLKAWHWMDTRLVPFPASSDLLPICCRKSIIVLVLAEPEKSMFTSFPPCFNCISEGHG